MSTSTITELMPTCQTHDWVAKIDLRQIEIRRVTVVDDDDGETAVAEARDLISEDVVEEYESKVVCRECDAPYPREVEFE